jgi:hypothetical protein
MEAHLTIFGIPYWITILVISITMAAVSIAATIVGLVIIPADYFVGRHRPVGPRQRHPVIYWARVLMRNVFGWILILVGFALLFMPGQGLLTVLLGLMLVDFPGKRWLEQRIVRRPGVRKSVDALRKRFGREPLRLDEETFAAD